MTLFHCTDHQEEKYKFVISTLALSCDLPDPGKAEVKGMLLNNLKSTSKCYYALCLPMTQRKMPSHALISTKGVSWWYMIPNNQKHESVTATETYC
jgi:hypothetical protein